MSEDLLMGRRVIVIVAALCALGAPGVAAAETSQQSTGTPAQIAWVRRAGGKFLEAELARDGAGVCAILEARLRATVAHRTCAERWDEKLAAMLDQPGERGRLRAERRSVSSARVLVDGSHATIALSEPLLDGASRLRWTESCWMLTR